MSEAIIPFTKLKPRQRKYLEGIKQGMSRSQAVAYANYAPGTSPSQIENPTIKAQFSRLMRQFAPADKLAAKMREGLEATKKSYVSTKEGVKVFEDVDYKERREHIKLAASMAGYVEETPGAQVGVSFQMVNAVSPIINGEIVKPEEK